MHAATECLGPGSPVATALPGFRPREVQIRMAGAVEEALADGHHLVVEAGTGVGKSFAYLVPALLAAAQGDGPILVATRTIALQEQLVERDIPFLLDALQLDRVPVALAKGRGNYVCLRRLEAATVEGTGLFEDPAKLAQLDRIRIWAQESGDGTRAVGPARGADRRGAGAAPHAVQARAQRHPDKRNTPRRRQLQAPHGPDRARRTEVARPRQPL